MPNLCKMFSTCILLVLTLTKLLFAFYGEGDGTGVVLVISTQRSHSQQVLDRADSRIHAFNFFLRIPPVIMTNCQLPAT